jgi:hypothetical protein
MRLHVLRYRDPVFCPCCLFRVNFIVFVFVTRDGVAHCIQFVCSHRREEHETFSKTRPWLLPPPLSPHDALLICFSPPSFHKIFRFLKRDDFEAGGDMKQAR